MNQYIKDQRKECEKCKTKDTCEFHIHTDILFEELLTCVMVDTQKETLRKIYDRFPEEDKPYMVHELTATFVLTAFGLSNLPNPHSDKLTFG